MTNSLLPFYKTLFIFILTEPTSSSEYIKERFILVSEKLIVIAFTAGLPFKENTRSNFLKTLLRGRCELILDISKFQMKDFIPLSDKFLCSGILQKVKMKTVGILYITILVQLTIQPLSILNIAYSILTWTWPWRILTSVQPTAPPWLDSDMALAPPTAHAPPSSFSRFTVNSLQQPLLFFATRKKNYFKPKIFFKFLMKIPGSSNIPSLNLSIFVFFSTLSPT